MARHFGRLFVAALLLGGSFAVPRAHATTWTNFVTVSDTMSLNQGRLCQAGDDSSELGCPTYAPYLTSGGLLGLGITPTVTLEVSGTVSATRFVGDGSGLSGVTAANSDRITSGTTSMVAISSTGFISVTQSGTNTAYFHPSMGLVAVGVSTTGPISGTYGFFSSPTTILLATNSTVRNSAALTINSSYAGIGVEAIKFSNAGGGTLNWSIRPRALAEGDFALYDGTRSQYPFYINGNGNIGLGNNTNPAATLQISGSFIVSSTGQSTTPSLYVSATSGYVGIGTNNPTASLQVSGNIVINSSVNGNTYIGVPDGTHGALYNRKLSLDDGTYVQASGGPFASNAFGFFASNGYNFAIYPNINVMTILGTGNVGIGTTTPSRTLHVSGTTAITSWTGIGGIVTPTTTLDVSGSIRVSSTGGETCNGSNLGIIRRDPATGHLQVCR